jgi:hypothetical protein
MPNASNTANAVFFIVYHSFSVQMSQGVLSPLRTDVTWNAASQK